MRLSRCLLVLCLINIIPVFFSYAQSDIEKSRRETAREMISAEQDAARRMEASIYGRVTAIEPDRNIISLAPAIMADDRSGRGVAEEYFVERDASFLGVSSIQKILPGDYITIDFYVFGGLNRATSINFKKRAGGRE